MLTTAFYCLFLAGFFCFFLIMEVQYKRQYQQSGHEDEVGMELVLNLEAKRKKCFAAVILPSTIVSLLIMFVAIPLLEKFGYDSIPAYLFVFFVPLAALLFFGAMQGKLFFHQKVSFIKKDDGFEIRIGSRLFRKIGESFSVSVGDGIEIVNSYTKKMAKRLVITYNNKVTYISETISAPIKTGSRNAIVSDLIAVEPGTIDALSKFLKKEE